MVRWLRSRLAYCDVSVCVRVFAIIHNLIRLASFSFALFDIRLYCTCRSAEFRKVYRRAKFLADTITLASMRIIGADSIQWHAKRRYCTHSASQAHAYFNTLPPTQLCR